MSDEVERLKAFIPRVRVRAGDLDPVSINVAASTVVPYALVVIEWIEVRGLLCGAGWCPHRFGIGIEEFAEGVAALARRPLPGATVLLDGRPMSIVGRMLYDDLVDRRRGKTLVMK